MKKCQDHSKDLEVKHTIYSQKKLTRFHYVGMMIIDYRYLVESYPYGRNTGKVCKTELLKYLKIKN